MKSGLLEIVDRDLRDANVALISEDRRFEAAYSAARTAANIAYVPPGTARQRRLAIMSGP